MADYVIGIDIGGTKVAFGLVDAAGKVHAQQRIATADVRTDAAVLANGVNTLLTQVPAGAVGGIGIGCPGHIDPIAGVAKRAVNLGWEDFPLVAALQTHLSTPLPVWIDMDVRAALRGEQMFGAAQGVANVVQLALGTGLGGAALVGGGMVTGGNTFAMEVGHWNPHTHQRRCNCGRVGCVETVLSGRGVELAIAEHRAGFPMSALGALNAPTATDWLAALASADPLALHILAELKDMLGYVVGACAVMFNPQRVVISGGFGMAAASWLLDAPFYDALRADLLPELTESLEIVTSTLESSTVGAAALAWHQLNVGG